MVDDHLVVCRWHDVGEDLFERLPARERGGVLVSREGSEAGTFDLLPDTAGKDLRVLAFQRDGDRIFLWAGIAVVGSEGEGVMRIEARSDGIDPAGWTSFGRGWKGGSCDGIDFAGRYVVVATYRAGALRLDLDASPDEPTWAGPRIDCGLPISTERNELMPVVAVAAVEDEAGGVILAATEQGVFSSNDKGSTFRPVGRTHLTEQVPLPQGWLYCVGPHALTVTHELGGE